MPKKVKPIAGLNRQKVWTSEELTILRDNFSTTTNKSLAEMLGRGIKSITWKASLLSLKKTPDHLASMSRLTALKTLSPEHMRAIGSRGGKIGGTARAEALTANERQDIARAAIKARWSGKMST